MVITGSGSADQRWRGSATVDVVDGRELRDGQLQINLSEGLARVPGLVIRNREMLMRIADLPARYRKHFLGA